ncbi:hypothetical protein CTAYLR_003170 [Chrysophaeum taylorii]|uniref:Uncharacterized protein n=1 Tax=Chrysophaeum taylorii TaxID=2483200 RepID=A0AAD7UBE9_9STRA|nr:hypothetical protein CTAYLR_003170 [Chrysophaeum taylorii]
MEAKLAEVQALNAQLTAVNARMAAELRRRTESLELMREERREMLPSLEIVRGEVRRQAETIMGLQSEMALLNTKHKQTCRCLVERLALEMKKRDTKIAELEDIASPPTSPNDWWTGKKEQRARRIAASVRQQLASGVAANASHAGMRDEDADLLVETVESFAVEVLALGGNRLGWRGAAKIAEMLLSKRCVLVSLNLRWNRIGDDGVAAISRALEVNNTLVDLDLWDNGIGAKGAASLGEALARNHTLATLSLWDNPIGDDGVVAIAAALDETNAALSSLDLTNTNLGPRGLEALSATASLQTLHCGHNPRVGAVAGATALARALENNNNNNNKKTPAAAKNLRTLYAEASGFGDFGAQVIARALETNTALTELNLADNKIGADGAAVLVEVLGKKKKINNSTLRLLHLDHNINLGPTAVVGLCETPGLHELTLAGVNVGTNAAGLVAQIIAGDPDHPLRFVVMNEERLVNEFYEQPSLFESLCCRLAVCTCQPQERDSVVTRPLFSPPMPPRPSELKKGPSARRVVTPKQKKTQHHEDHHQRGLLAALFDRRS